MSLYAWTVIPLAGLHLWLGLRHRQVFKFQLLLDVVLAAVLGGALATGADLNPIRCIENDPPFRGVEWSQRTAYQPTQSDVTLYFHPWWEIAGESLRRGELPLIAPGIGAGLPLLANGQTAVWAPMMAPVWLHGPERGTTVMALWKLEVAGLGAFLLMSVAWRLRFAAAAVGGVAWAASPYLVAWLLVSLAWVAALTPWLWWLAWWMMRRVAPRWAPIAVGAVLGWTMGCGLHPETAVVVCGSALAAAAICHPRRWPRLLAAAVTAAVVALVLAWPTIGYISASSRVRINTGSAADNDPVDWQMRRDVVRQIVVPASMGHPGRGDWRPSYPHAPGAAGVGGAVLALLAAGGLRRRHRRIAVAAGFSAAVGAVLLIRVPLLDNLLMSIPPIGHMTVPRFAVLLPWGLAVLASLSLQGALTGRARPAAARLAPAAVVIACAVLASPWELAPADTWLVVATVGAAVAAGVIRARRLLPLVVAGELALLAVGVNPVADPADRMPEPRILSELRRLAGDRRCRITGIDRALQPNLATRYGLRDLRAADPLRPAPFARLMRVLGEPEVIVGGTPRRAPAGLSAAWGVGLAITPPGQKMAGWSREHEDGDGALWSNPAMLHEVRVVGRAVPEPEDLGELLIVADNIDYGREAMVAGGAPDVAAEVVGFDLVDRTPTRIEAVVSCDGTCLLVVAQPWAPGWRASVDGATAPLVRTNIAGLGVVVPPGDHRVELRYRPWRWGGVP